MQAVMGGSRESRARTMAVKSGHGLRRQGHTKQGRTLMKPLPAQQAAPCATECTPAAHRFRGKLDDLGLAERRLHHPRRHVVTDAALNQVQAHLHGWESGAGWLEASFRIVHPCSGKQAAGKHGRPMQPQLQQLPLVTSMHSSSQGSSNLLHPAPGAARTLHSCSCPGLVCAV